jgi:hypothetical protein
VLQVLEDWNGSLKRAPSLPHHILINRTPVGDKPHTTSLCAIGVSFNRTISSTDHRLLPLMSISGID